MGQDLAERGQSDFRDEAVALSLTAVAKQPQFDIERGDLTPFGTSLCLPATGNPAEFRRRYGRVIKIVAVLGIGGVFGGVLLAGAGYSIQPKHPVEVAAGIVCAVVGNVLMISAIGIRNLMFARYAARVRLPRPLPASNVMEFGVSVEEPSTVRKMKAVTEDIGQLFLDSVHHIATIEGFSHRYVIRSEDLRRCVFQRTRHATHLRVEYAIASTDQTLAISISYNTASHELKRQRGALRRPPLAEPWEQAMGVAIEPAIEPAPPLTRR